MPKRVHVRAHYRSTPSRSKNTGCPLSLLLTLAIASGCLYLIHMLFA